MSLKYILKILFYLLNTSLKYCLIGYGTILMKVRHQDFTTTMNKAHNSAYISVTG